MSNIESIDVLNSLSNQAVSRPLSDIELSYGTTHLKALLYQFFEENQDLYTDSAGNYKDKFREGGSTQRGTYWPSTNTFFTSFMQEAKLAGQSVFDLGSGTGDACYLLDLFFGATPFGIEYDRDFHVVAQKRIGWLQSLGLNLRTKVSQGDFLESDISSYDALYYFISGTLDVGLLEDKLLDQMRPGQKLAVFGYGTQRKDDFLRLKSETVYEQLRLGGLFTKK